jgi:hypothetical protein
MRILALPILALLPMASALAEPATAIAEMAQQFDKHPLIMIGELHRSMQIHKFLQQMLRDPAFICKADDVVVEFGNARLQALADTYVSGGAVTQAQLQSLWRETAVPLTWNSPVYRQVYETVRDINKKHLCAHPLRIVLGDPALDWSKIKNVGDYKLFTDRDGHYAEVVEREVLAKHHRALLIAGQAHALKKIPPEPDGSAEEIDAAQIIERNHPGSLFCIVTVPLPEGAMALNMGDAPSFRVVHGGELEHTDFQLTDYDSTITRVSVDGKDAWKVEPAKHWPEIGEAVDGILYVGGNTPVYPSPTIYLDPIYQHELLRRAAIIKDYSGQDFISVIDDLIKQGEQLQAHN